MFNNLLSPEGIIDGYLVFLLQPNIILKRGETDQLCLNIQVCQYLFKHIQTQENDFFFFRFD